MVRKHSRSAPIICTMDFTGFSVVMVIFVFVLLTIMMTFPPPAGGSYVDLPRACHAVDMRNAGREDALIITIPRDGRVYLCGDSMEIDSLAGSIRERLAAGAPWRVYLEVDKRAKYRVVLNVLNAVRSAGFGKVNFLVEKRFASGADL